MCGFLLCGPAFSGQPRVVVPTTGSVTLYTEFQHEPPQAVLDSIQDELRSTMAATGNQFEWHSLAGVRGNEVVTQLAVVTFRGRCDVGGIVARPVVPGALGWTHVSNGEVLPFSEVDCDSIREFLQIGLLSIAPGERELAYGRAVARVLAHELYHVLARTAHHGTAGVGKAAFNVHDLLSPTFVLEEAESQKVRTSSSTRIPVQTDDSAPEITR